MTEKEKELKNIFNRYNANVKRLQEIEFSVFSGVDYTKQRTGGGNADGREKALVSYIDEKRRIEQEITIVERSIWFYRLNNPVKMEYIKLRYFKHKKAYQCAMELYTGETTIYAWDREIMKTAERVAVYYGYYKS